MSGSSMSFNAVQLVGCRVAGAPTYTPGYVRADGKELKAMCSFNVYQNINDKSHRFRITAWGNAADVCARSCAPGKEMVIFGELGTFMGKNAMPNQTPGTPIQYYLDPTGNPIETLKTGVTLRRMLFGADSAKQIAEEINDRKRPVDWDRPGTPGNLEWQKICQIKNAEQYVPGNATFGYARVRVANGVQQAVQQIQNQVVQPQAQTQPVGTAQTTYVQQPAQQYAQQPAQQTAQQYVQQPAVQPQTQTVMVHDTPMGQVPASQPAQHGVAM